MDRPRRNYDLLAYHELADSLNEDMPEVGDDAHALLAQPEGWTVVAVGPPIHQGKDATIVVAFGKPAMPEVQALLNRPEPEQAAQDPPSP